MKLTFWLFFVFSCSILVEAQDKAKPLSPAVVAAWKKAGFAVGRVGPKKILAESMPPSPWKN